MRGANQGKAREESGCPGFQEDQSHLQGTPDAGLTVQSTTTPQIPMLLRTGGVALRPQGDKKRHLAGLPQGWGRPARSWGNGQPSPGARGSLHHTTVLTDREL